MLGAMRRLLSYIFDGKDMICSTKTESISRAAFPNSLCTHSVKRDIVIEYYPINRFYPLRKTVTEAVRYTENDEPKNAILALKLAQLICENIYIESDENEE